MKARNLRLKHLGETVVVQRKTGQLRSGTLTAVGYDRIVPGMVDLWFDGDSDPTPVPGSAWVTILRRTAMDTSAWYGPEEVTEMLQFAGADAGSIEEDAQLIASIPALLAELAELKAVGTGSGK